MLRRKPLPSTPHPGTTREQGGRAPAPAGYPQAPQQNPSGARPPLPSRPGPGQTPVPYRNY